MQLPVAKTGSDVNMSKLPAHVSKLPAKLSLLFGISYISSIFPGMWCTPKVLSVVEILLISKVFPWILYTSKVVEMLTSKISLGMLYTYLQSSWYLYSKYIFIYDQQRIIFICGRHRVKLIRDKNKIIVFFCNCCDISTTWYSSSNALLFWRSVFLEKPTLCRWM